MLLIHSENTDIYWNLAAEDYLLHHSNEDILMFWRSEKSVVCGKHQNVCAEANYSYCRQNNIALARRLTGGGTVFHDMGNINFTFIKTIEAGLQYAVDYKRFLEPIRQALDTLGITTSYSQRNDLLLNGKKISGNAEHVLQRKNRVLHHGTLLYNANLNDLGNALHADGAFTDKAVKSIRSVVTNIANNGDFPNTEEFLGKLLLYFDQSMHTNRYVWGENDINAISELRNAKYSNQEWIIGYSPAYFVEKELAASHKLQLRVKYGTIEEISILIDGEKINNPAWMKNMVGKILTEDVSLFFADNFSKLYSISCNKYILF